MIKYKITLKDYHLKLMVRLTLFQDQITIHNTMTKHFNVNMNVIIKADLYFNIIHPTQLLDLPAESNR